MSAAMWVVQAPIFQSRWTDPFRVRGTVEHPGEAIQQWVTLFIESVDVANTPPYVICPIPAFVEKVDSQRADPVTGEWEFRYLNPDLRYMVLVYDKDEIFDPVMKLHLVPEPM